MQDKVRRTLATAKGLKMDENFTMEKLKIHERLVAIETRFDGLDEKVDVIYKNIVGNGNIGIKTKVDRLEQSEKNRKEGSNRLWTAIITIATGLIGKISYDLFKR